MGSVYRFLSTVEEAPVVLDWFRMLQDAPVESAHEQGTLFFFGQFGAPDPEPTKSPLVSVILPASKRALRRPLAKCISSPRRFLPSRA